MRFAFKIGAVKCYFMVEVQHITLDGYFVTVPHAMSHQVAGTLCHRRCEADLRCKFFVQILGNIHHGRLCLHVQVTPCQSGHF